MNDHSRARNRARLLAFVAGIACTPALFAQALPFAGRWLLEEPAPAGLAYPTLTVKDTSMTWSGRDKSVPPCVQQFTLKKEAPGTSYTNGRGTKFIAGITGSLPTYLLRIDSNSCKGIEEEVRISYPLVYDTRHIEVIEYVKGKPVTSRRFRRGK